MSNEQPKSVRRQFLKLMAGSAVSASFVGEAFGKPNKKQKRVKVTENKNWKILSIKKADDGTLSSDGDKHQQKKKDLTEEAVKIAKQSDDLILKETPNKIKIKCRKQIIKKKKKNIRNMKKKHRDKIKKQDREIQSQINDHVDKVRSQVTDSIESDTVGGS